VDGAKLAWARNAAAAGARVCSELPEDNPPDHAWSSLGNVAGNAANSPATASDRRRDQSQRLIVVVAGNGPFPSLPCRVTVGR